jgi:DNA adenine methylase
MKSKVIETDSIKTNLKRGHQVLQNTKITSKDFTFIREEVEKNDLVFLDPPYQQESNARHFDEYQPGGFDEERQKEVRDLALELHRRGAYVMITNSPDAKGLYVNHDEFFENFRIKPIKATRSINSDSSQRAQLGDTDILVTNSPQFWEQKDFDDFR